ncbi:hypothetical protein VNO80_00168 [Phaseolus coccineus]|uniref:Uncharacterized protein n=1 Tax=Phaseolus coccineus TaxID=3886 RepID=A0AAN9P2D3_PHACN
MMNSVRKKWRLVELLYVGSIYHAERSHLSCGLPVLGRSGMSTCGGYGENLMAMLMEWETYARLGRDSLERWDIHSLVARCCVL